MANNKTWEVVHVQPWNGKEVVIKRNLTEAQANEYFYGIENAYIRNTKEGNTSK